jgi:hypothetical protein
MKSIFSLKSLVLAITVSTLSACGGGGGGGGDSKPASSGGGTTPITNTAPTISLDSSSASINENGTYTLGFTTSDKENDNVSVSITGGASHISTVINGNSITFNSSDIDLDITSTFSVKASDSKTSSTASFSLEVLNVEENVETTTINLTQNNIELLLQEESIIDFTLANNETIDSSSFNVNFDETAFNSVVYIEGKGLKVKSRNKTGNFDITFSVSDINGVKSNNAVLSVSVVDNKENIEAPILSSSKSDKDDIVLMEVESFNSYVVPFTIEDADSNSFGCFYADGGSVTGDPTGFDVYLDCDKRELQITTVELKDNAQIEYILQTTDGVHKSNVITLQFRLVPPTNENAKIDFNYEKPFLKIEENTSKTLSYTITDDGATEVVFNEIQHWYGNESDYTITHNTETKSFVITPDSSLKAADSFGVLLSFKDGNDYITHYLEVKITAPIGEVEALALNLVDKYENAMKSSREYNELGKAMTDYLFSVGKITYTNKEAYDVTFTSDSRDMLGVFGQYKNDIQERIENGEFTQQPASLNYFIDYYDENLSNLLEAGSAIQSDLNTLSNLDSVLPSVTVTTSYVELDTKHISRLIGNTSYGQFINNKFTFNNEYKFLNVISGKTNNSSFVN